MYIVNGVTAMSANDVEEVARIGVVGRYMESVAQYGIISRR